MKSSLESTPHSHCGYLSPRPALPYRVLAAHVILSLGHEMRTWAGLVSQLHSHHEPHPNCSLGRPAVFLFYGLGGSAFQRRH